MIDHNLAQAIIGLIIFLALGVTIGKPKYESGWESKD